MNRIGRAARAVLCVGILAWCAFVVYAPIWWGETPPRVPMLTSLRPSHEAPAIRPRPWPPRRVKAQRP